MPTRGRRRGGASRWDRTPDRDSRRHSMADEESDDSRRSSGEGSSSTATSRPSDGQQPSGSQGSNGTSSQGSTGTSRSKHVAFQDSQNVPSGARSTGRFSDQRDLTLPPPGFNFFPQLSGRTTPEEDAEVVRMLTILNPALRPDAIRECVFNPINRIEPFTQSLLMERCLGYLRNFLFRLALGPTGPVSSLGTATLTSATVPAAIPPPTAASVSAPKPILKKPDTRVPAPSTATRTSQSATPKPSTSTRDAPRRSYGIAEEEAELRSARSRTPSRTPSRPRRESPKPQPKKDEYRWQKVRSRSSSRRSRSNSRDRKRSRDDYQRATATVNTGGRSHGGYQH